MIYGIEYYENMLRNYSASAEQINKIRWDWIEETNPTRVLDYGSGVGWFRAWRPYGVEVETYDIDSFAPQTGYNGKGWDVICLWDVLEHLEDLSVVPWSRAQFIALTVPVYSGHSEDLERWKHFKPGEHVRIFRSRKDVIELMEQVGFTVIKAGTPECPPRQDIVSFLFKCK